MQSRSILDKKRTNRSLHWPSCPKCNIVAKVGVLRAYARGQGIKGRTTGAASVTAIKEILVLLEDVDDDRAIARYFLARMPDATLLDVTSYEQAAALAKRRPDLDARRADVVLTYKIFTQLGPGGPLSAGYYSGLAASSTGASRMKQHLKGFKEAAESDGGSAGRISSGIPPQRILYNPRTLLDSPLTFVATSVHFPPSALIDIWGWTTTTPWRLQAQDIHRVTASLDEMILCLEFEDLGKVMPGLHPLPEELHLPRRFMPLNATFPSGLARERASSTSGLIEQSSQDIDAQEQALRRKIFGRSLETIGVEGDHEAGSLTVKIADETHTLEWDGDEDEVSGKVWVRLMWLAGGLPGRSGSPLAATPTFSQLLDHYEVFVRFPNGKESAVGFSGARQFVEPEVKDILDDDDRIDDNGWGPLLETLHWAILPYRQLPTPLVPAIKASRPLLTGIAQRLVSLTGCALDVSQDEQGRWLVEVPLLSQKQQMDKYALCEVGEDEVVEDWRLPIEMQPPKDDGSRRAKAPEAQSKHYFLLRAEGKKHLQYLWQGFSKGFERNSNLLCIHLNLPDMDVCLSGSSRDVEDQRSALSKRRSVQTVYKSLVSRDTVNRINSYQVQFE